MTMAVDTLPQLHKYVLSPHDDMELTMTKLRFRLCVKEVIEVIQNRRRNGLLPPDDNNQFEPSVTRFVEEESVSPTCDRSKADDSGFGNDLSILEDVKSPQPFETIPEDYELNSISRRVDSVTDEMSPHGVFSSLSEASIPTDSFDDSDFDESREYEQRFIQENDIINESEEPESETFENRYADTEEYMEETGPLQSTHTMADNNVPGSAGVETSTTEPLLNSPKDNSEIEFINENLAQIPPDFEDLETAEFSPFLYSMENSGTGQMEETWGKTPRDFENSFPDDNVLEEEMIVPVSVPLLYVNDELADDELVYNAEVLPDEQTGGYQLEDTSEGLEENMDTTIVLDGDRDTSEVLEKDMDTTIVYDEAKDTTIVLDEDKDTPEVLEKDMDSTIVLDEDKDTTIVLYEDKDTSEILEKDKDTTIVLHEDTSGVLHQDKDTIIVSHEDKDTSEISDEYKDTTIVFDEDKDTSKVLEKDKDTTIVLHEDKDTSAVLPEDKDTSGVLQEDKDTSSATHEDKDTSGVLPGAKDDISEALHILKTRNELPRVTSRKSVVSWSRWNISDLVRAPPSISTETTTMPKTKSQKTELQATNERILSKEKKITDMYNKIKARDEEDQRKMEEFMRKQKIAVATPLPPPPAVVSPSSTILDKPTTLPRVVPQPSVAAERSKTLTKPRDDVPTKSGTKVEEPPKKRKKQGNIFQNVVQSLQRRFSKRQETTTVS